MPRRGYNSLGTLILVVPLLGCLVLLPGSGLAALWIALDYPLLDHLKYKRVLEVENQTRETIVVTVIGDDPDAYDGKFVFRCAATDHDCRRNGFVVLPGRQFIIRWVTESDGAPTDLILRDTQGRHYRTHAASPASQG